MAEPVIVTIPHKLTKEEAARRLKKGFADVRLFGEKFVVLTDDWKGDHLDFKASLLGQTTTGTVDVAEDRKLSRADSLGCDVAVVLPETRDRDRRLTVHPHRGETDGCRGQSLHADR